MTIRDLLCRWLGCDECHLLLDHALDVIETVQTVGRYDQDDEVLAEQVAAIKEFLGR